MSPDDPAAPPPDAVLVVDPAVLVGALHAIPDGENALLRLADGRRTVEEIIAGSGLGAPAALASLVRLLDAGVLRVVPPGEVVPAPEHPGSEGADWFAHPVSTGPELPARLDPPSRPDPASPPASAPEPPRTGTPSGRARGWLGIGAIGLGAVVVAGAVSALRKPEPTAPPSRVERPAPERPPPALAVTEPSPSLAFRDALSEVGVRQEAGDLAGAAAACRRAIAIDPASGAGWLALGEVSLAAGDGAGARAAFEHYLAVEPGGSHAARVRALLDRLRP